MREQIPNEKGEILRVSADKLMQDHVNDLPSPFMSVTLSQGRIERFLLDAMDQISESKLAVERGVSADSLIYDPALARDHDAYPISVTLRTLSDDEANPKPASGAFGGRDILTQRNMPPDERRHDDRAKQPCGSLEIVKARYLIGADGAHSWLRSQLHFKTVGSQTDSIW